MIIIVAKENAALAQSVERRLGKAEVGGSSPLGSSHKKIFTYILVVCEDFFVLSVLLIQTPVTVFKNFDFLSVFCDARNRQILCTDS